MHDGRGLWNYVIKNVVFNIKLCIMDTNTFGKKSQSCTVNIPTPRKITRTWLIITCDIMGCTKAWRVRCVLLEPWCFPCNRDTEWILLLVIHRPVNILYIHFDDRSQAFKCLYVSCCDRLCCLPEYSLLMLGRLAGQELLMGRPCWAIPWLPYMSMRLAGTGIWGHTAKSLSKDHTPLYGC